MPINARANTIIHRPIETTFEFVHDKNNAPKLMTGMGNIIAGIDRIEWIDGEGPYAGARRRVFRKDGTIMLEEFREYKPPYLARYRLLGGLPKALAATIKFADATWQFQTLEDSTSLTWDYEVYPRNLAASAALLPFVKVPVQKTMQATLQNIKSQLEAA